MGEERGGGGHPRLPHPCMPSTDIVSVGYTNYWYAVKMLTSVTLNILHYNKPALGVIVIQLYRILIRILFCLGESSAEGRPQEVRLGGGGRLKLQIRESIRFEYIACNT